MTVMQLVRHRQLNRIRTDCQTDHQADGQAGRQRRTGRAGWMEEERPGKAGKPKQGERAGRRGGEQEEGREGKEGNHREGGK